MAEGFARSRQQERANRGIKRPPHHLVNQAELGLLSPAGNLPIHKLLLPTEEQTYTVAGGA
jgi:hypothetical protein